MPRAALPLDFAVVAGLAVLLVLAHPLDQWAWRVLRVDGVYSRDLGRLLRIMGFAPTWYLGALILVAARWALGRPRGWRCALMPGVALAASVTIAGVVGEALKFVVRRERPGPNAGAYDFAGWDPFVTNTASYGFPSTHAIVAFAAAFSLARLSPRSAPIWIVLAAGCGFTRLLAGAHFLSDVVAAALLAWVTVAVLHRALRPECLEARTA